MDIKQMIYERTLAEARGFGLQVLEEHSSMDRPWGAYLRFSEDSLPAFYRAYWEDIDVPLPRAGQQLDPKILIVAPGLRLSLQYHHRRREHWRVLDGPVKIVIGKDRDSLKDVIYKAGDVIRLERGEWHRLVGMDGWGRVAEIWEHTDPAQPSGEDDIVRVEDDFGR